MLDNSPKVSTVELDLSHAIEDLEPFEQEVANCTNPVEFFDKAAALLMKITEKNEKRAVGFPNILGENESADYVISSLVASQLVHKLKVKIFELFEKKFLMTVDVFFKTENLGIKQKIQTFNVRFSDTIAFKHIEDLCKCGGKTYFADTFERNEQLCFSKKVLTYLIEIKKPKPGDCKYKDWFWMESRKTKDSVSALLV